MKTRISKGRDGFEARTEVEIGNNRVLVIRTGKTSGGLCNSSTVWTKTNTGHLSMVMFQDYSQRKVYKGVRCTEKTVTEIQKQALSELALIIGSAQEFYAVKEYGAVTAQTLANVPSLNEFSGVAA